MASFWMHLGYFGVILYAYKAYETYQVQKALGVDTDKAIKAGVLWPKYSFK